MIDVDWEIQKANDAIKTSMSFMYGIDIYQRKSLEVIMRMCYLKGILESAKERERMHDLMMEDDEVHESRRRSVHSE